VIKDFFNFLESKRNTECVDCGGKGEAFFVKNDIWYNYIPKSKQRGIICLSCLEKRLGRKLKKSDFQKSDIHLNQPWWSGIED
jgi:hypothetical protein